MHRLAYALGVALFGFGVIAALVAWRSEGTDLLRQWARSYRPESDGMFVVWLGLWDALLDRGRQIAPLVLPVAGVAAMGVVQGMDWRLSQRMRGHHAHLLSYAWGTGWAGLGWVAYVILRPYPISLLTLAPLCLIAAGIMGFCVTAGLPAKGKGA